MANEQNSPITFEFTEIVTELLKKQNIHEGIWGLFVEFGLTATNYGFHDSDDPASPKGPEEGPPSLILPTAIIPIKRIGLARAPFLSNMSVDAAKVNPKPRNGKKKS